MTGKMLLVGVALAAVVLFAGCIYDQPYDHHRRGRHCRVAAVKCYHGYRGSYCYYEWWCKHHASSKADAARTVPTDGAGPSGDAAGSDPGGRDGGALGGRDGGTSVADAGTFDSGGSALGCNGAGGCSDGFECVDKICKACPKGVCPCRSDTACQADERCNLETGACERIPCGDQKTESGCLQRADCLAVYSGKNCKRPDGKACVAGDTDCTCESFSFAVCIEPASTP